MKPILFLLLATFTLFSSFTASAERVIVGHDLWIGYAGIFVAQEKGFFKEAGLEVELKPFSNPGDTLPALVAGKMDMALTTLHNLGLIAGSTEAKLTAVYLIDSSNGADAVVAKKEIATLKDLKGKTVAATTGEVNHMLLLLALESAGMKEEDIKLTNMNADDAGAAFVAGKVDAAVTWEPWVTKALAANGKVLYSSADLPDKILDSIVVDVTKVDKMRGSIEKFIAAIDKGVQFLKSSPDEAHPIIAKALSVTPDEVKGMLEKDKIYDIADNKRLTSDKSAGVYKSMQTVIEFLLSKKLIDKKIDSATLIDAQFIK